MFDLSKKNEDITREEYLEYKHKYENDIERLQNEKKKYENQKISLSEWIEKFKEQKEIKKLSRDIIIELIECIYVHENNKITIKFKL